MIDTSPWLALWAETRLREISLRFQEEVAGGEAGPQLGLLAIPVVAVAIGWAVARFANRPRASFNTPYYLFVELQRVHRLNQKGRKLVQHIAEEAELAQPATLFLGPASFDQAVERASHRARLNRRQQNTLKQVRRKLFPS